MQKITSCLWFVSKTEEAVKFYTSLFTNSKIGKVTRYDEASSKASGQPAGSILTIEFEIEGHKFLGLNGGPAFKINPSISFFLNFDHSKDSNARNNLDELWAKLSEGGKPLMPLDTYPFSERYGWIEDKYGISWQLILSNPDGEERPFIVPSLLFVGNVYGKTEEAVNFYLSVFKDAYQGIIARYPKGMEPDKEGTVMYTDFKIENHWFAAMDSAQKHDFNFNEAISFIVNCESQEEVDYYWNKLTAEGGNESQCGWLKDKYGVSWQIVPTRLIEMLGDPDPAKAQKVMMSMLQMKKIIIADLEEAYQKV